MAYFYYQKNLYGRWAPCMSEDRPSHHSPDGAKRIITTPVLIPETFEHMSLVDLAAFHPPKDI